MSWASDLNVISWKGLEQKRLIRILNIEAALRSFWCIKDCVVSFEPSWHSELNWWGGHINAYIHPVLTALVHICNTVVTSWINKIPIPSLPWHYCMQHYFCNSINFHEDLMICNFCHLLAHSAVWPDSQQQDYWLSLSPSALQTPRDNSANWHQKLSRLDKISRRPSFLVVMITLSLLSLCHVLRVEELK